MENGYLKYDKKCVIYTLVDPISNCVRYVGKTIDIKTRIRKHMQTSNLINKTHKNNWINNLLNLGLTPKVEIVDEIKNILILNEAEIKWIKYYKDLGCDLTNGTDGGDGGKPSLESIEKAKKTKLINNTNIGWWKGKKFSVTHCDNISKGKKGYIATNETKTKLSVANKGLNTWSKGRKFSEETKSKMNKDKIGKIKNNNPIYQLDLDCNIIKYWNAPYFAEKELKLTRSKIHCVCIGERKTTGGFKWVYVKDYKNK